MNDHTPETCPVAARHDERLKTVEGTVTDHGRRLVSLELWRASLIGYVAGGVLAGTFLAKLLFDWRPRWVN